MISPISNASYARAALAEAEAMVRAVVKWAIDNSGDICSPSDTIQELVGAAFAIEAGRDRIDEAESAEVPQ